MGDRRNRYGATSVTGMARGLGGMMSYYAMIGVLLGILALCVGGPLVIFKLLDGGETPTSTREPTNTHYRADKNTPAWLRPFVGSYDRHGQALDIAPDGSGTYRSRTYTTCDRDPTEPCEKVPGDMPIRVDFTVVQSGNEVVARTAEQDSTITLVKPGVVEFDGNTYCESEVADPGDPATEACGA